MARLLAFLDPVMDAILGPLLNLPPLWVILIISLAISLLIVVIYKFATNQKLMKDLKDELKAFQKQMKELKEHPEEVMKIQKKAMQTNMKYMMHSLRPTLITFIPIILIFSWLQASLAYDPLLSQKDFTATLDLAKGVTGDIVVDVPRGLQVVGDEEREISDGTVVYTFNGKEGEYLLTFSLNDRSYDKEIIIADERKYAPVIEQYKGDINSITLSNEKTQVLNLFGWRLGWLGAYIIFSIVFSVGLRRLFKVY